MAPRLAILLCLCGIAVHGLDWQTGTLAERGFGSPAPPGSGACGYGDIPATSWPSGNTAAVDPSASPFVTDSSMAGCGLCLEVECVGGAVGGCASGSVTVLVTDLCEGCGAEFVYVSGPAFRSVVTDSVGQVAGRFRQVPCNPNGNMVVSVDTYRATQGGWIRLSLQDVAGSGDISSVEIKGSSQPDSAWKPMKRTYGAVWEASTLPQPPLDLRVTSDGEQVVATGAITMPGVTGRFPTNVQFKAGASGAPAGSSPLPASPAPPVATLAQQLAQVAAASPSLVARTPAPEPATPASPPPAELPALATPASPPAAELQTAEALRAPAPELAVSPPEPEPLLPVGAAEAAAPATEVAPAQVELLAPGTALAAPVGVLAPAAPAEEPLTEAALAPAPAPEGLSAEDNTTMGAFTEAGIYCASCTPCALRADEPVGMQPVPVDFVPIPELPTLPTLPAGTGPAVAADVATAGKVDQDTCSTMLELLEAIPEAADWLELMRRVGLEMLLSDPTAKLTLLVPAGEALNATINACPLRNETMLSDLLVNAPELTNPLVGYHVLRGLWPSNTLQPGVRLNTSDTIDKVNFLQIEVGPSQQLRGIGSNATILQGDIVSCGPSVIHVIDAVLLPFTFNQGAIDAISGTQPPQPANVTAPTVASGNVTETPTTLNVSASQGPPTPAPGGRRLLDLP